MSWTYFRSMVPVQLEFDVPHICLNNDRFHLDGRGDGGRIESDRESAVLAVKILHTQS